MKNYIANLAGMQAT